MRRPRKASRGGTFEGARRLRSSRGDRGAERTRRGKRRRRGPREAGAWRSGEARDPVGARQGSHFSLGVQRESLGAGAFRTVTGSDLTGAPGLPRGLRAQRAGTWRETPGDPKPAGQRVSPPPTPVIQGSSS